MPCGPPALLCRTDAGAGAGADTGAPAGADRHAPAGARSRAQGIGGGGSFVHSVMDTTGHARASFESCFDINWLGCVAGRAASVRRYRYRARSHSTRAGLVRVLDVHAGSAAVSTVSTTCRGPSCPSSSLPRRAPSSTQAASTDSGASVLQIEVELCSSCGLLHVTGHRLAHRSHTSPVSPPPSRPPALSPLARSTPHALVRLAPA
jgi:hypothetical protein